MFNIGRKVVRVRSREDLPLLRRGDLVYVCGEVRAYHGMSDHYKEPTFVSIFHIDLVSNGPRIQVYTPLGPVFRKILGGIKSSGGSAMSDMSLTEERAREYVLTAQKGGLLKSDSGLTTLATATA